MRPPNVDLDAERTLLKDRLNVAANAMRDTELEITVTQAEAVAMRSA